MKDKIKPIDKKILNLLQKEDFCVPRITKIAHQLQIPVSSVQARIRRMQIAGVIKGFSAVLEAEKLGKGYVAFILGQAKLGESLDLEKVAKKLVRIPQIQELFFITGDYDYLVKLKVKDKEEYYELIQKIGACFEVRATGIIAPKCFKETQQIVIE